MRFDMRKAKGALSGSSGSERQEQNSEREQHVYFGIRMVDTSRSGGIYFRLADLKKRSHAVFPPGSMDVLIRSKEIHFYSRKQRSRRRRNENYDEHLGQDTHVCHLGHVLTPAPPTLALVSVQIRQLQAKRSKASREIIHLAAEARLAVKMTNKAVAAYVTFDDEMAAIEARVRRGRHCWL